MRLHCSLCHWSISIGKVLLSLKPFPIFYVFGFALHRPMHMPSLWAYSFSLHVFVFPPICTASLVHIVWLCSSCPSRYLLLRVRCALVVFTTCIYLACITHFLTYRVHMHGFVSFTLLVFPRCGQMTVSPKAPSSLFRWVMSPTKPLFPFQFVQR